MAFHFDFEIARRIALRRAFLAPFGGGNERSIGIDHFAQLANSWGGRARLRMTCFFMSLSDWL
jgi:hypothetical protein